MESDNKGVSALWLLCLSVDEVDNESYKICQQGRMGVD